MPIELIDPDTLARPAGFHHVAVATGARTAYLAGQVSRLADGSTVGAGDLAAQVEQAYVNIAAALDAIGGTFDDVAKVTMYVVDWQPDKITAVGSGMRQAANRLGVDTRKAMTLIGVSALVEPELLVEIDVVAVLP